MYESHYNVRLIFDETVETYSEHSKKKAVLWFNSSEIYKGYNYNKFNRFIKFSL